MLRRDPLRRKHGAPCAEYDVDALFSPCGHAGQRAGQALLGADSHHAQFPRCDMPGDVARRRGDKIDVPAHQRRYRFRRAFEGNHLHVARVAADGLHQQARRDVIVAAEQGRKSGGDGFGVFAQARGQVFSRVDRSARRHGIHSVIIEQRRNRREVGVMQFAGAGDVVGEYRRAGHHQHMRVRRVLMHIRIRDVPAATRLVDHRQ